MRQLYGVKIRKSLTLVYVMWGILLFDGFLSLARFEWYPALIAFITFVLTLLPFLLQKRFELSIPSNFLVSIVFFITATVFLGEVGDFYEKYWWWDIVLHGGSAIGFGILGFVIMLYLTQSSKLIASPFLVSVFSFSFATMIGVMWEVFEFSMDQLFGLNMQKSGLVDTMSDFIINSVGAFLASFSGYLYLKHGPRAWLSSLIHPAVTKNRGYFRSKIDKLRKFHVHPEGTVHDHIHSHK